MEYNATLGWQEVTFITWKDDKCNDSMIIELLTGNPVYSE